jgi:hypothetical protein
MAGALAYKLFDSEYSDAEEAPRPRQPRLGGGSENHTAVLKNPEPIRIHVLASGDIRVDDSRIILHHPIPLYVEGEHGQYIISHEESRIHGLGPNVDEALRDFGGALISVYHAYVHSEDPLTPEAQEYSRFLKQLVKSIEKV